jgi:hypothetical protein
MAALYSLWRRLPFHSSVVPARPRWLPNLNVPHIPQHETSGDSVDQRYSEESTLRVCLHSTGSANPRNEFASSDCHNRQTIGYGYSSAQLADEI